MAFSGFISGVAIVALFRSLGVAAKGFRSIGSELAGCSAWLAFDDGLSGFALFLPCSLEGVV